LKGILIAAGRGRRLMPLTEDVPKCYATIGGRRILDWCVDALGHAGCDDIVFVGGYRMGRVQADYPRFRFVHNVEWERNNILLSLFAAEREMAGGFVASYADILYTPEATARLVRHPGDIVLLVDTEWRARYRPRTQHPESDGEKVRLYRDRVTEIGRRIPAPEAPAEFTGVAKFTAAGARVLAEHFHRARVRFDGRPFRGAAVFARAYLVDLLQAMLEAGVALHAVETPGGYFEVDTTEDHGLASRDWTASRRRAGSAR
jgi:choline kinase